MDEKTFDIKLVEKIFQLRNKIELDKLIYGDAQQGL